ncbi:MAG: hypothetical protein ACYCQI_05395 [Gammaproteobacteria bacterium]
MKPRNALQLFSTFKYPLSKPLKTLHPVHARYDVRQLTAKNLSAVIGLNEHPNPINKDWVIMYPVGTMATHQDFLRKQLEATNRENLPYLQKDFYQIHYKLQLAKKQLKYSDESSKAGIQFSIGLLGTERKLLKKRIQEGASLGLFRLKPERLSLCSEVIDLKNQETVAYMIHKDALKPDPKELFLNSESQPPSFEKGGLGRI